MYAKQYNCNMKIKKKMHTHQKTTHTFAHIPQSKYALWNVGKSVLFHEMSGFLNFVYSLYFTPCSFFVLLYHPRPIFMIWQFLVDGKETSKSAREFRNALPSD